MRKNRVIEQDRCYHLISRLAHRAFFLDDEEKDRAVALMRRVEAGVKAIMSYCINRTVSISSDPFGPREQLQVDVLGLRDDEPRGGFRWRNRYDDLDLLHVRQRQGTGQD